MIDSSKAVCWTGRVGLVCRDCREAQTNGEAGGARRISKRAAIEEATGMPSLQRFAAASGRSRYLSARIARDAFGLGLSGYVVSTGMKGANC
jgi:hypothetical protein